jgi:hypothetical protein
MKAKFKSITLITALMLLSFNSFSQTGGLLDILMNKVWKMETPEWANAYMTQTETYTATQIIVTYQSITSGQPIITVYDYYISNTVDAVFDESKLGTVDCEKNMIIRPVAHPDKITVFDIVDITEHRLALRNVLSDKYVTIYRAN